jgi:hypothetical protein
MTKTRRRFMTEPLAKGHPLYAYIEAAVQTQGIREEDLLSSTRGRTVLTRQVTLVRQALMVCLRQREKLSFPAIATLIGVDHSTVQYACRTADGDKQRIADEIGDAAVGEVIKDDHLRPAIGRLRIVTRVEWISPTGTVTLLEERVSEPELPRQRPGTKGQL